MAVSKANQRAVNKYKKNNYDRIEVTVPKGQRAVFQSHASTQGESVNGFINRAIQETMSRDLTGGPVEATGGGGGILQLSPDTVKAAREAAEAAGEAVPVFIGRAVTTQAQRDKMKRSLDTR